MNQFIKGVLTEQLAKLIEDKQGLDSTITTMQSELKRLLIVQAAMQNDIEETQSFLKGSKPRKKK